jgi:hypothetical protein
VFQAPEVKADFTLDALGLRLAFVWPGLVSLNVYPLLMPAVGSD